MRSPNLHFTYLLAYWLCCRNVCVAGTVAVELLSAVNSALVVHLTSQPVHVRRSLHRLDANHWSHGHQ